MRTLRACAVILAVVLSRGALEAHGQPAAAGGKTEVWEGKLGLPGGLSLRMVFHVTTTAAGPLVATFDSPDQGAKGLKVDSATIDKGKLILEMKALAGKYEGTLNADGGEAVGSWTQGGARFPLTLRKAAKASEVSRPQTPKPPFPYKVEDVSYANEKGGVTLAGTLTIPKGSGPFPAVVLISGSGAQDRDETIFEHRPFLVIADALTRRGIAVLRVDDRGVGGSSRGLASATSEDFAGDVLAGVQFLKARREIAGDKIGLIGHSEGGMIAPIVASRSPDIAFIVLLAGTGLPGDEILVAQVRLISRSLGLDEKAIAPKIEFQRRIIEIAKSEPDEKVAEAKMKDVLKALVESSPAEERKALAELGSVIDVQLKSVRSPWFRFFLTYDPRPALAKVHCPVLALIGENDLQVPPKENLAEIRAALEKGGNTRATVKQLAGLNHLFQTSRTGSPTEYATIEETIAPSALSLIGDWITEQTKHR